jgi:hypothetical protein
MPYSSRAFWSPYTTPTSRPPKQVAGAVRMHNQLSCPLSAHAEEVQTARMGWLLRVSATVLILKMIKTSPVQTFSISVNLQVSSRTSADHDQAVVW